jgi:hypothetical protein
MALDLETPLGFGTFLANNGNMHKVSVPATFDMSKIIQSIST